ncbi:MAG: RluA family pseudouridine synthase [Clostridia bacterium]
MPQIIKIAQSEARLDVLVSEMAEASRSQAAKWIAQGLCRVAGREQTKAGLRVAAGEELVLEVPEAVECEVEKENIPLDILYEDADLAVVNKPCGMVVHPAAGNETGTMVNALLYAMDSLSGIGGVKRPGIVHRLDKDTSGLLLVAKNDAAHQSLSLQLSERSMEKHYLAVVEGVMKEPSGLIDRPIARSKRDRKRMAIDPQGRMALTEWTLLQKLKQASLLDVHILTGRTHQIRIHMQSIGHPVAGDVIYGQKNGVHASRLMLHAHTLAFTHPSTGERLCFTAPPPQAFLETVAKLTPTVPVQA